MNDKRQRLQEILQGYGRVCVAFSAGVDSGTLLEAAHRALPGRVLAVMATGIMVPDREVAEAEEFCRGRGIPLAVIDAEEMDVPQFLYNEPDRCYHCKRNIFSRIQDKAAENGFSTVVEGSNADDVGDYRPGMRALAELGIRSPLLEAGLAKAEIREMAREYGVPFWDKPAAACLATRIPYGTKLSRELLSKVDEAETAMAALGLTGCRVRIHDALVRLEVPVDRFGEVAGMRSRIVELLKAQGFLHVCLDLEGYVKGSMNRAILPNGGTNGPE